MVGVNLWRRWTFSSLYYPTV